MLMSAHYAAVSPSPVLLQPLVSNHPSLVLPADLILPSPRCHTSEGLVHVELGLTDATLLPAEHPCPIPQTSSGSAVLWAGQTET